MPLRRAYDNVGVASALLKARADPNAKDSGGSTALHRSAEIGQEIVAKVLIEAKGNPNVRDEQGNNVLHHAAYGGHVGLINMLRANGADKDAVNAEGETPLKCAETTEKDEAVAALK